MEVVANHIEKKERILRSAPVIKPVDAGIARPHWSVMIPVYNCSAFLPRTLMAVLDQDPGEEIMQIEVVDDASTDADVKSIVSDIGRGRIKYYRQESNVGSLRNFLTCLDRSSGMLVHLLHGDDFVKRGFYQRIDKVFNKHRSIGAAFSRYEYIDEHDRLLHLQECEMDHEGILENWLERLCERQRIQYVAMVVRRDVYEKLGGFYGAEYGEDWEMWVRIAAHYPVGYIPDVLASYRRHKTSISGRAFLDGKNMRELSWVMDTIRSHLPESKKDFVLRKSRKFYAHYALRVANSLWKEMRHRQGAKAQVRAAWNMQKDPELVFKILKLFTRMTLNL